MTTPDTAFLIPVVWAGLALSAGTDPDTGLLMVVEDVTGWYDSPPLNGGDIDRALSDGSAYGPKVLGARVVVIQGAVVADQGDDPASLIIMRDQLAGLAAGRNPALLAIDDQTGRTLTATVRADTDQFHWTFVSPGAFRYQVSLTAADPRLYDSAVQSATLSNAAGGSGWTYARTYPRTYGASAPNTATLANAGNAAAPVLALYTGALASGSRLTDGTNTIFLAALAAGEQVYVQTDRLVAYAPGGASRQSYILPGSVPMSIPPGGATWSLLGAGGGSVQLGWQAAWT